ncbi:HPr Serine kinase N terminus [Porphyromonadaceae bacterium NLAE-zl-C104]|nr:HPr Serine kinase N terminus [Porphyromonadaceae bacterium KH3R12]SFS32897.1 HPr Serine kinase N terminus [Porphyromonadaceae bacterium NLAE-zl-C104]
MSKRHFVNFLSHVKMNVDRVNEIVNGKVLFVSDPFLLYTSAFASDLMSDVLRYYMENTLLITGLCTLQAVRTAEISNISCIIFARGKRVSNDMLQLAKEYNIAIIESGLTMFEISGRLYQNGLKPIVD